MIHLAKVVLSNPEVIASQTCAVSIHMQSLLLPFLVNHPAYSGQISYFEDSQVLRLFAVLICRWQLQEGLIINPGSVAGLEPMKATPVYAASKWGIRGWSLSCYEVCAQSSSRLSLSLCCKVACMAKLMQCQAVSGTTTAQSHSKLFVL